MKLFTDVKIGKRLGVGFGITIILTAAIVLTGILCVGGISSQMDRMVKVNCEKTRYANNIRSATATVTYLVGELVTAPDRSAKEEIKSRIEDARATY